ncbi:Golgi resident protein GCP60 [Caenorhabditis elegans]|uniref:Golgi resident protein GCP60 n=3 Tax=Caenorhabditis elegans TaxID=6239 RepID=O62444_CAEEL|nr:Golgi resident protein GCP60 [Caenorhabditis elegans]CAB09005.2 Golgi resident protein GCP60 [Caenorhabditis elegans]|eukprot:NP_001041025.1 Uncharacterized protein CELE_Y41E3.7 [Caenorhabditis elegans]
MADENHVRLSEVQLIQSEFGHSLEECYKLAVQYYKKEHVGKQEPVGYEDRIKLLSLSKQVQHGEISDEFDNAGWLDITGNDVNKAWRELGSLSRDEAMASFVFLVDRVCPPFKGFIADKKAIKDAELKEFAPQVTEQSAQPPSLQQVDQRLFEDQRKQIQEALNAQTFHQFSAYAQEQFPGQPEQQTTLIRQLQEQHYQQYMSQVYAQQSTTPNGAEMNPEESHQHQIRRDDDSDVSDDEAGEDLPSNPAISPASLWNRQDINEFKANIKKDGHEGIIKVGHGETVTVRVPTHENGSCLFWEFATDHYDIGFGVYFEWTVADSNQVSVHVSESDDEEDYDEALEAEQAEAGGGGGGAAGQGGPGDVEAGAMQTRRVDPNKPRQDEIIPVYRRDCHEEVYAGSHRYPGRGIYLLKFDNSYSLWRSKTLYYRVYYSK